MFPGGLDVGKMQKYVKDMQKKLQQLEQELKERIVEGSAAGGMVKVKVNGLEEVVTLEIEEEVFKGGDKTMLQDLVMVAVNDGVKKAKKLRETEYAKITGMNMSGLSGLLS